MRLFVAGAALIGLAAAVSGCVQASGPPPAGPELARVDPNDAAERAVVGGVIGATVGAGLGATVAISPPLGAAIGAGSGAAIGSAIGAMTAQPIPAYAPIAVPRAPAIPGFFDTWPPGLHLPPIATQTPPPPA